MKNAALVMIAAAVCLAGCAAEAPAAAPTSTTATATATPSSRATVTVTPTPNAVATSGSFAADVTKLGIKPDNMQSYATWMKERICDQDSIGLGVSVRSVGGGTPASGGGIDVVRLTNAYFCPAKTQEIEVALDYFD